MQKLSEGAGTRLRELLHSSLVVRLVVVWVILTYNAKTAVKRPGKCHEHMLVMNAWSRQECSDNMDTIIGWLCEEINMFSPFLAKRWCTRLYLKHLVKKAIP